MRVTTFVLAISIILGVIVRLVPTLYTQEPFSVDVWPLIRLSNKILESPDTRIWNDTALGGYNNKWPAVLLETVCLSRVSGLAVDSILSIIDVMISILSLILMAYILILRRDSMTYLSTLSILVISSIPSFTLFTSTTLKEVYSYPIALSIILITLVTRGIVLRVTLLAILSLSISLSHPLTPLMILSILSTYLFVYLIDLLEGYRGDRGGDKRSIMIILPVLGIVYLLYTISYGWGGLRYVISLEDLISLTLITASLYGWYALFRHGNSKLTLLILLPIILYFSAEYFKTLSSSELLLYVIPLVLLLLPNIYFKNTLIDISILPIAVAIVFIVFIKPLFLTIVHRVLDYLIISCFLASLIYLSSSRLFRVYTITSLITSIFITMLVIFNVSIGLDQILFYWRYTQSEVESFNIINSLSVERSVCGDVKVMYFLGGSSGSCQLEFLRGVHSDSVFVLYRDNYRYGYVLSPIDIYRLDDSQIRRALNLVYNSMSTQGYIDA
ncbi:MAG: hypothetical protein ABWJ42_03170 [Sulfolobales archaeon]